MLKVGQESRKRKRLVKRCGQLDWEDLQDIAKTKGLEVMMADPGYIADRRDRLLGLVITHAHEDHLGAVADLWPLLEAPVFATPFAASVLRRKLTEAGLQNVVPVTEIPLGGAFELPPFGLEMITMTHSIPEPNAVAIRTPLGTVIMDDVGLNPGTDKKYLAARLNP